MATKAQLRAQAKYDKQNTKQIILKLNIANDADILAKLSSSNNKQGYIKELVREDMRRILSLEDIKCLLMPIINKYGITSLSVFGSYARNEAKPDSDVDLLIDGGHYQGLEYISMIGEMKKALNRAVDVVTQNTLDNSNSEADKIFKSNIERDRVKLW